MRPGWADEIVELVEPSYAHVTLDLHVGATPIRGSFHQEEEDALPFEGWIELASLIDAAARVPDRLAAGNGDTSLQSKRAS